MTRGANIGGGRVSRLGVLLIILNEVRGMIVVAYVVGRWRGWW